MLLLAEGHAVGALVHSGVHLMGTHQDLVQGAEVFVLTVVGALLNGALDTLVGMAIHNIDLLWIESGVSMGFSRESMLEIFSILAICGFLWYCFL